MSKIIDAITELATPVVEQNDCQLWDIEYVKEPGGWVLRIFIDRPDGVSINHCEAVSRALDPILDEHEDIIPGSYTFEVSSAGAERHLRRPSDFERFMGNLVEVKLYKSKNGQKVYTGILTEAVNNGSNTILSIEIDVSGDQNTRDASARIRFEKSEIASVRLRLGQ